MTNIPPAIAAIASDGQISPAQRRRFIIKMGLRRIKPGSGSSLEFLHRRTAMTPWPDLRPILQDLPWAVVDAVATRAYMPERATTDLDILVHQRDGDEALKRLQATGYQHLQRPRLGRRLGAIFDLELAVNLAGVPLDRAKGQDQLLANLPVGTSGSHQLQHL